MGTCLRALASGYISIKSELLHVLDANIERGPQSVSFDVSMNELLNE